MQNCRGVEPQAGFWAVSSLRGLGATIDTSAELAGTKKGLAPTAERCGLPRLPLLAGNTGRRQADSPLPKRMSDLGESFAVIARLQATFDARAVKFIDRACSADV